MFRWIWLRKTTSKDGHRCTANTQCGAMCLAINPTRAAGNNCNSLGSHGCRKARRLRATIGSSATRTNNTHRVLCCGGGSPARPQHDGRQRNRRQEWRVVGITKHHGARTDALHGFALSAWIHRPKLRVHALGSSQRHPFKARQFCYRSRQHRLWRAETRQRGMMERWTALISER